MGCGGSKEQTKDPNAKGPAKKEQKKQDGKQEAKPAAATIFVLGGPGSGKGTQCEKIKERYEGVVHLSAGDLLRAEAASGSEVGNQCAAIMKEGKLVPLDITIGLLKKAMAEKQGKCHLIDGFPRAQDQATKFEADIGMPATVLFFDCPEEEMEKRLLKRGETSGRSDDNTEAIRKRFQTFVQESKPVQGHYEAKGLARVISAVPPPDQVFEEVIQALDPILGTPKDQTPATPAAVQPSIATPFTPSNAATVFVLGGPGSGKGTQCEKIKARYEGVVHLSAGDLLRAEAASGSEVGNQCAAIMKEGKLVPLDITIGLLKKAMAEKQGKCHLIDGFPRAQDQATKFEADIGMPATVLFFDCPEEEMEKRLLKRGETSGRSDDNTEAIRKRFQTFVQESKPVQGHYEAKGLARVISAVPPPDQVFEEVIQALDPILGKPSEQEPKEQAPQATDAAIVFVLGGPGSGKGTQCAKIKERYAGVVHLSAGDLLRAEAASGSEVGNECAAIMKEGKLVPVSVTIRLLKKAMAENRDGMKMVLIDGFPRALDQAARFEEDISLPQAVLFFECPEEEMEKRLLKRGETSGRSDDNTEAIRKRFKTFVDESLPVKGHYAEKGLAHAISAVPPPDEVFESVTKVLDNIAPTA